MASVCDGKTQTGVVIVCLLQYANLTHSLYIKLIKLCQTAYKTQTLL